MSQLKKRIYYAAEIYLESPLCIASGEEEYTDKDVIRDWDGAPFIPGSSLAGAFRSFCQEQGMDVQEVFGYTKEASGSMSALWICDLHFEKEVPAAIRDGVRLEQKVAVTKGKYECEVLEEGNGILHMSAMIWREGQQEKVEQAIRLSFGAIGRGELRLGTQKNRGFGKLRIGRVYRREFGPAEVSQWLEFDKEDLSNEKYEVSRSDWMQSSNRYVELQAPLELRGGLSIRRYATGENLPDFTSLTKRKEGGDVPVIPGSSWKGAIRERMCEILRKLQVWSVLQGECLEMFGYVSEEEEADAEIARPSRVIVSESVLLDYVWLNTTRNSISRFENATVDTALYTERTAVGGTTCLEILVKTSEDRGEWFVGLLLLALRDLQNGYLAVGGNTSVGRGIFKGTDEITIQGGKGYKEYIEALRQKLQEVKAG